MFNKEKLHQACKDELSSRIAFYNKILHELSAGAQNDSKSSAGDKHETSRAMMQLEQEKIGKQLKEAEDMQLFFDKMDSKSSSEKVTIGSLILTNEGFFYLAAALGKLKVGKQEVYVLSPKSPLGARLQGSKMNDVIQMNSKLFKIISIS